MEATQAAFELDRAAYNRDTGTYRFEYDRDETSASMAVVAALSSVTDTDPTAMEPLATSVDADAVDALLDGPSPTDGRARLTLTHGRHSVTVYRDGVIDVTASDHRRTAGWNADKPAVGTRTGADDD